MSVETTIFRDLAYVFGAAVVGGAAAKALKQPLILGYLLGGVLVGPFTPGPTVSEPHVFQILAEVGVVLLMYSIGLEFSFRDLLQVKWVAILGGPLGLVLTIGLASLVGWLLGWTHTQGFVVGAVISVASTMVLARFLADRGDLRSPHGQVMIGITLVEDLAVVVMTVLLSSMHDIRGDKLLALGLGFGKAILILIPVIFLAAKLVPPLMKRVAQAGNEELYLLFALALGFATAAITEAVGLSLALGAFLAGLIVSGSDVSHTTLDRLLPFRDAFVALFFVTIGALVDPHVLISHPGLWITIVVLTVAGKFVVWSGVVRLFGYPWRTAAKVGVGLTQIGEFSYVLIGVAWSAHLVDDPVYNATLAASVVTILLNGMLMKALPVESAQAQGA